MPVALFFGVAIFITGAVLSFAETLTAAICEKTNDNAHNTAIDFLNIVIPPFNFLTILMYRNPYYIIFEIISIYFTRIVKDLFLSCNVSHFNER
jgi:hypothetical protein